MVNRTEKLSNSDHLFLFGARGTGKTTLIRKLFGNKNVLWVDLLTEADEERFGRKPESLSHVLAAQSPDYVIIDEIQKFPKLLDIIHHQIESNPQCPKFVLTGSSARKLKRAQGNLLGGRARSFQLYPFTADELGGSFDLQNVLEYGSLPIFHDKENQKKPDFLRSYVRNYLKEEIIAEQVVRQVEPFRDFLEIAAQMNTQIINYSKIARDVGVSDQTVKTFFQILEETWVGHLLPSFNRSIRKRQREAPKFYYFDLGVTRSLQKMHTVSLPTHGQEHGKVFEHFIILEVLRKSEYLRNDFRLSYFRTKDDAEIDLVIERPGKPDILLEIKSTTRVTAEHVRTVGRLSVSWDKPCQPIVCSLDPLEQKIGPVFCLPWQEALKRIFD